MRRIVAHAWTPFSKPGVLDEFGAATRPPAVQTLVPGEGTVAAARTVTDDGGRKARRSSGIGAGLGALQVLPGSGHGGGAGTSLLREALLGPGVAALRVGCRPCGPRRTASGSVR